MGVAIGRDSTPPLCGCQERASRGPTLPTARRDRYLPRLAGEPPRPAGAVRHGDCAGESKLFGQRPAIREIRIERGAKIIRKQRPVPRATSYYLNSPATEFFFYKPYESWGEMDRSYAAVPIWGLLEKKS